MAQSHKKFVFKVAKTWVFCIKPFHFNSRWRTPLKIWRERENKSAYYISDAQVSHYKRLFIGSFSMWILTCESMAKYLQVWDLQAAVSKHDANGPWWQQTAPCGTIYCRYCKFKQVRESKENFKRKSKEIKLKQWNYLNTRKGLIDGLNNVSLLCIYRRCQFKFNWIWRILITLMFL